MGTKKPQLRGCILKVVGAVLALRIITSIMRTF
jgi:hypothetical protein